MLDATNWTVTHALQDYLVLTAQAADRQVLLTGSPTGGFTPPNGIAYAPPPFDLIGANEQPVVAFAKVPFV